MTIIKTIKPAGGGDYTTLQAWWDAVKSSADADQQAVVYAGNSGALALGNSTNSTKTVLISAATGAHSGVYYAGTKAGMSVATGIGVDMTATTGVASLEIVGLEFDFATDVYGFILQTSATVSIKIRECTMRSGGGAGINAINVVASAGSTYTIDSNLIYGNGAFSGGGNEGAIALYGLAVCTWNVRNNTVTNLVDGYGIQFLANVGGASTVVDCRNNYAGSNTTCFRFSGAGFPFTTPTWSNNASVDTSSDTYGANNLTGLTPALQFVNPVNDVEIIAGSSLIGAGADLTGIVANNALGTAWVVPYFIGGLQFTVTTVTVSPSVNPSTFGQTVAFATTISGAGGTPTGSIIIKDGTTSIGTGTLSGGTATFSTAALATGTRLITAIYGGDSNYATSTSNVLSQVVSKISSAISVGSNINPSQFAETVTFTASVSGAAGDPTGAVFFDDGTVVIGTGTLTAGVATFQTAALATGTHSITGVYPGDSTYNASNSSGSPVLQVVGDMPSSNTTITTSANPVAPGVNLVITATITGSTPTGTVTFYANGNSIGTGSVSASKASLNTSSLAAGNNTLVAAYGGDGGNSASVSVPFYQAVCPSGGSSIQPVGTGSNVRIDSKGGWHFFSNGSEVGSVPPGLPPWTPTL